MDSPADTSNAQNGCGGGASSSGLTRPAGAACRSRTGDRKSLEGNEQGTRQAQSETQTRRPLFPMRRPGTPDGPRHLAGSPLSPAWPVSLQVPRLPESLLQLHPPERELLTPRLRDPPHGRGPGMFIFIHCPFLNRRETEDRTRPPLAFLPLVHGYSPAVSCLKKSGGLPTVAKIVTTVTKMLTGCSPCIPEKCDKAGS